MKAFISHNTALEYWRINQALPFSNEQRRSRADLPDYLPDRKHPRLSGLSSPLHIIIGKADSRRQHQTMKQHVLTRSMPEGSFIRIDDELFVSSPEFIFLQMASQLPLAGLIELGYELCGTYSKPVAGDPDVPERGFYIRKPLSSKKRLEVFLTRMPSAKGCQKALRAWLYIFDGSASPMETKLSIFLTLPYKLGGFGLARPELNRRIVPSKTDKRFSGKASYVCDLFWPDYNLAVEYDSVIFHAGSGQIADDSMKRNTLTLMGITVISVTKQQLYSTKEFEKTVVAIAKCLRKRLKHNTPGFAAAHHDLRKQLL